MLKITAAMPIRTLHRNRGFTLVELLVALVIGAILLVMGVPGLQSILQNNRAAAFANDFISTVNFARSEAVKRGREVRVSALDPSASANEWGPGWRVWIDTDGDNAYDAGEELWINGTLGDEVTLDSIQNASEIRFLASGFTTIAPGQIRSFALQLPGCLGEQNRTINVTPIGYVNVARVACS